MRLLRILRAMDETDHTYLATLTEQQRVVIWQGFQRARIAFAWGYAKGRLQRLWPAR